MSIRAAVHACFDRAQDLVRSFALSKRANVAMIFGLTLIPIAIAAGVGLDMARGMVVRARLTEALDAAGLAVGGTTNLSTNQMQTMAQSYFNANYTVDSSYGTPASVSVSKSGQVITLTTNVPMPTTLMRIAGISTLTVHATSQITYGQTKLWVSLVLDNTGSMTQTDSTGLSKISALKTATNQLLTLLQGAATNAGDVKVAIIPFSKTVNVGTSNVSASWIRWDLWEAPPANGTPASSVGPSSNCPYTTSGQGYVCQSTPTNGSSSTSTIPGWGSTYQGYICPGTDNGSRNSGFVYRYYNGCYTSVGTVTTGTVTTTQPCVNSTSCTTSSYCSGYPTSSTSTSGATSTTTTTTCACVTTVSPKKTCTRTMTPLITGAPFTHTWTINAHSTWGGCVMDRDQSNDVSNTAPTTVTTSTLYPAENSSVCVPSVMMGSLSYSWSSLTSEVNAMTAGGSTNQTIGLAWGWQSQSNVAPFNPGALPAYTSKVIIILSDGLNTQNRWNGDGADDSTDVDGRMSSVCTAAKADGAIIYAVFVDIAGAQGNSSVLQNCATDTSHYFDLTTSASISTAFATIGQQITNLRVSQ